MSDCGPNISPNSTIIPPSPVRARVLFSNYTDWMTYASTTGLSRSLTLNMTMISLKSSSRPRRVDYTSLWNAVWKHAKHQSNALLALDATTPYDDTPTEVLFRRAASAASHAKRSKYAAKLAQRASKVVFHQANSLCQSWDPDARLLGVQILRFIWLSVALSEDRLHSRSARTSQRRGDESEKSRGCWTSDLRKSPHQTSHDREAVKS